MKRAFCIIVMALLAFATLGYVSFAEVSNPNTECGDNPKYNKYQIGDDGSVGELETNVGMVVTLSANNAAERTYDYANTDTDTWTLFRIVLKHGQTENGVINDPAQSGTVDAENDISHITFCLKAAEAPPTTGGGGETGKPDEGGSQETGGTVDNQTGGNTSVQGSTDTRPNTSVLGENLTRAAAQQQATPQAQAAMLAATGPKEGTVAWGAAGLLLIVLGLMLNRRGKMAPAVS